MTIRVIDIFAGPGGLSEGFASVCNENSPPVFDHRLSIEMEPHAFQTLKLRTFFRYFLQDIPEDYYYFLRGKISLNELYEAQPEAAKSASNRCWNATLGPDGAPASEVKERIGKEIKDSEDWVLIGGPPCQAYSLVGRSRNKGNPEYDPQKDVRQKLYVEYLQILADHRPAVFIMENVKGLLSAKLNDQRIFNLILKDLRNPAEAIIREGRNVSGGQTCSYQLVSLINTADLKSGDTGSAVVRSEEYGIPQARHRVILLGIRDDIKRVSPKCLKKKPLVAVSDVLCSLPSLRSGLSRKKDSAEAWESILHRQVDSRWANAGTIKADNIRLSKLIKKTLSSIQTPFNDRGGEFIPCKIEPCIYEEWYGDERIGGVINHSTRGHMEKDLFRYMFASCYAKLHQRSPSLKDFPIDLLPKHTSAESALQSGSNFSDRFRVQSADSPSTTIVSHISKDGHYYIHPDPEQCRSLTVREAARLQTFPDNYYFCGPRTAQYIQVGNAVPPLLAKQIGEIVYDILHQAGADC